MKKPTLLIILLCGAFISVAQTTKYPKSEFGIEVKSDLNAVSFKELNKHLNVLDLPQINNSAYVISGGFYYAKNRSNFHLNFDLSDGDKAVKDGVSTKYSGWGISGGYGYDLLGSDMKHSFAPVVSLGYVDGKVVTGGAKFKSDCLFMKAGLEYLWHFKINPVKLSVGLNGGATLKFMPEKWAGSLSNESAFGGYCGVVLRFNLH